MEYNSKKAQEMAQSMGNTIGEVVDKLAGTSTEVTLRFEDLTFDAGAVKAKMTGAIKLETVLAKEAQGSSSKAATHSTAYSSS